MRAKALYLHGRNLDASSFILTLTPKDAHRHWQRIGSAWLDNRRCLRRPACREWLACQQISRASQLSLFPPLILTSDPHSDSAGPRTLTSVSSILPYILPPMPFMPGINHDFTEKFARTMQNCPSADACTHDGSQFSRNTTATSLHGCVRYMAFESYLAHAALPPGRLLAPGTCHHRHRQCQHDQGKEEHICSFKTRTS